MHESSPDMAPENQDVRMRGFSSRKTVEEALLWVDRHCNPLPSEIIPLEESLGRVLATDICSDVDVPQFDRSMMDGFAVRAEDTNGASTYNSIRLNITDESLPGKPATATVQCGDAVRIMTGAPMPDGANAVIPVEHTTLSDNQILVHDTVPERKHVGEVGEDVESGAIVFQTGRELRPQDVGVLSSIGKATVEVVRQPIVRLLITGSELVAAGQQPGNYQIADANGPMLAALITRDGGIPSHPGITPDNPDAIREQMQQPADILLVSGGSSVGQEDHAPVILAEDGHLAIHGIAMRPSSPTGMGLLGEKTVFLLPGNPVSCFCAYDFFAGRAIRQLTGKDADWPYQRASRPLARKLVSKVGRTDYARVQVIDGKVHPMAISGASVLTSTTRADGFVVIPEDSEGYAEDSEVMVHYYG